MKKKIEYWVKHQELDKFNYNTELSAFIGSLAIIVPGIIGMIAIILAYDKITSLTKLITILIFGGIALSWLKFKVIKSHKKILNDYNQSFRIREAMLRVWYRKLRVNTDLLDEQFEEIKEKSKGIISNKELELIAKKIINKKRKSTKKKK